MRVHIASLFMLDAERRLLAVNEPGRASPAPRLFLGRTRDGNMWRFSAGLPDEVAAKLDAICRDEPAGFEWGRGPRNMEKFRSVLTSHSPLERVYSGPAYYFDQIPEPMRTVEEINETTAHLLSNGFEDLHDEIRTTQPFVALVENGRAVSVCRSVRVTPEAHEAGVETLEGHRGQGLAADAASGWAKAVAESGALPMYSTSWENKASQAVARKLGLIAYGADFHIR